MEQVIRFRPSLPARDDPQRLLAEVLGSRGQPLERSTTLPPAAYTSDAFFQLELDRIFQRGWLPVAHVSQLPKVGDYLALDLFGQMLMVVRGPDRIRVLSRICLHRWAPLVQGSGNTRTFKCPFHAWGYALDGRLLGAPLMEQAEGFEPKTCRLPEYRSEVIDGYVYMTFSNDAAPLAPRLADMLEHIGNYRSADLVHAGSLSYVCRFNWKIAVETFMECYHHLAAHPISFERDFPARLSWGEDTRPAWTVVHAPARPGAGDEVFLSGLPLLPNLTPEESGEFRLYLVYPYQMIAAFPDRIIWFALQPEAPDRTRLQTHVLLRPETLQREGYTEEMTKQFANLDTINLEDISVNEAQQRGAATMAAEAGRLSHLEKALWQLADYVRDRMAAA